MKAASLVRVSPRNWDGVISPSFHWSKQLQSPPTFGTIDHTSSWEERQRVYGYLSAAAGVLSFFFLLFILSSSCSSSRNDKNVWSHYCAPHTLLSVTAACRREETIPYLQEKICFLHKLSLKRSSHNLWSLTCNKYSEIGYCMCQMLEGLPESLRPRTYLHWVYSQQRSDRTAHGIFIIDL